MKLKELIGIHESLGALLQIEGMTSRQGLIFTRLFKKTEFEFNIFNEKRSEIIKANGKPLDDGNYDVKGNEDKVRREIESLLDVEINFSQEPITMADLDGLKLPKGSLMYALEPFIVE